MKLPLSWLNEYVKVDDIAPAELAEKLTRAGLQVEAIETVGPEPLSDLIVVAEVLECAAHPDSDHLHVCRVTDGRETFQVVCGAPNMRQGIKTAFAKIGALIPEGNFKIKKGKLRGVESFGMCCSEKELHIGAGESGIIEYPAETPTGALVRDVANLPKPEVVFDIEVTWNRSDALSIRGLAREYSAILNRPLKQPELDFTESDAKVQDEVKVVVEDPEKCPRYTARVITSVEDGPSPEFMAKRLELCGVRSLGLVVDVTNYVMLELGQPMHAFDYKTLKDRTVVVRNARAGEKMKTLDGVERTLDTTMLCICDAEKPNCIAGVMGGEESKVRGQRAEVRVQSSEFRGQRSEVRGQSSEVRGQSSEVRVQSSEVRGQRSEGRGQSSEGGEGTRSVLLESALFDCASTKYTSTKLGLASESSYRYIRGVDLNLAEKASRRAAHLLQKYGKAVIAKGVIDVDNRKSHKAADGSVWYHPDVTLDFERARRLIGIGIGNDVMVMILWKLGLMPREKEGHRYAADATAAFGIPSWRRDLELEADLVEEIARIYGLDNIPDTMPSAPSVSPLDDAPFRAKARVRELCCALGFTEAMHYSFLSAQELDRFDTRNVPSRLAIPDPVSAEYGVMRDSLLPQLMASLGRNASHQLETARLFEIGKVFSRGEGGKPAEAERLSLGFVGPVGREALRRRAAVTEEEAVLWLRGAVEELLAKLHAGKLEFAPADHPAFTRGASLEVKLNGRAIGVLGALSAKFRHPYRLTTQMALCELELKPLLKNFQKLGRVSPVPQFPLVRRDIALVAAKGVTNGAIEKVIRQNGGKDLVRVELFDVFRDSRAYSLEFRSAERTLTDEEVGRTFQRIVDALKATAGIEVREG